MKKKPFIKPALRLAMLWPHTWAGVTLGGLLMVIFFMGSLSVFAPEIDRWMMPSTRLEAPDGPVSLDQAVRPLVDRLSAGRTVQGWFVRLPEERNPVLTLRLRAEGGAVNGVATAEGAMLPPVGTLGASSFFYPLHYSLHLRMGFIGIWIVSFATVAMLVGLISGVIIHARIFKDVFTFRSWGQTRRSVLDLHNLTGVLALPFHLMISFTGVVIIAPIVLPSGVNALYGGGIEGFYNDAIGGFDRPRAGVVAPLAPLDPMVAEARRLWGGGKVGYVQVLHPGDAAAYVRVSRSTEDRISLNNEPVVFDGVTGAVLKHAPLGPVVAAQRFLSGLHIVAFHHWSLRWLYFLLGLSGCALIGSGLLCWLEKRRAAHGVRAGVGWRVVAAMSCATTVGLLLATLAMMAANRALPADAPSRAMTEVAVFFGVWIASAIHAGARSAGGAPWRSQTGAAAGLAVACVALNGLTTGDHPFQALADGKMAVFGVDSVLLLTAALASAAAFRLGRSAKGRVGVEEAKHA